MNRFFNTLVFSKPMNNCYLCKRIALHDIQMNVKVRRELQKLRQLTILLFYMRTKKHGQSKHIKGVLSLLLLSFSPVFLQAQNVQLHYDFGRGIYPDEEAGRPKVTMTLEQFKADPWGAWFYFVDIDFSRKFTEGAYAEISREINLGKQSPFAAHIEYDGGLNRFGSFQQAVLVGPAWNGHSADFSKTCSVQLMYKHNFKSYDHTCAYPSIQLTGVWSTTFAHKTCTFSGFIDLWRGEKGNRHGQLVVLTEPQFWYHATSHFSIGTEWEISSNFIYNTFNDKSFFFNPTLAVKWDF